MKRPFVVATTAALIIAIGAVGASPAAAAPPTDPWDGSAGGEVVSLTTDAVGLQLAGLGVAVSDASAGSAQTPRANSVSSNISADVAGLGLTVASNDQTAPPDAGGPETGSLAALSAPGLLDIGALTTTNEAHWDVDTACVTDGALSLASTQTAGLSLLPLLGGGVLDLGVSESQGETSLVQNVGLNHGVQSVATGTIESLSLLGGAITVDVDGETTLTATATGTSAGTVDYAPSAVTVNTPGGPVILDPGNPTAVVSIPLVADVTITLNDPTVSTTATSAAATSSLLTIDVSVLGVFPLPPVAEVSVDVLPLSASATAPTGGIDCPPAPPVILVPAEGATTDSTPVISGTSDPNAFVTVLVDGASVGGVAADGTGNWNLTSVPLAEGPHVATAIQTVAGTPSAPSVPVNFVVDATAPPAPVITAPADGSTTNDTTPDIVGTAEADSTVEVFIDGASVGTTTADGTGAWTFTPTTPLGDGEHTAVATATDAAGNTSGNSNTVAFTVDTGAPAAPIITAPADGSTVDDATPDIVGSSEANATVEVFIDGASVGTTAADGAGAWTLPLTTPLAEGPHTALATATDETGNTSLDSTPVTFTVDTATPAPPVITSPVQDEVTSDPTPPIVGIAEANTEVTVYIDGALVGTVPVDGAGAWSITPSTPLDDGAHTVTATAEDAAGNVSDGAVPVTFTVDTAAPLAPVITAPADGSRTNDTTPDIVGTAEANATVNVSIDGAPVGTTTASGTGSWTLTPTAPLAEGAHTASATATDAAGSTGPESNTVTFTIDLTAPAAPVITAPADGSTTNDSTPPIVGTAEANATVNVSIDGAPVGTADADGSGDWTFTPPTPLAQGPHTASATATDGAGNTGPVSNIVAFTVDSIAPAAPVITSPADGSSTADTTPPIVGTAEPGSTVTVSIDGAVVGTTPADGTGSWTLTPPTPLAEGEHTVTATATDALGNVGPASEEVVFTIDTTAPTPPVITSPPDGSVTSDTTPPIVGTAEAGATVTVMVDGVVIGTTIAGPAVASMIADGPTTFAAAIGSWTLVPTTPLSEGLHRATATATDAASNVSLESNTVAFTIDAVAPQPPVITSPGDGTTVTDPAPPITGTAEPGSEVEVSVDGRPIGTTTTDADGNWTLTPTTPLPDGEHEITATATDPAGNVSVPSDPVVITVDTGTGLPPTGGTAPLLPTLLGTLLIAAGAALFAVRRRRA
ncbi:Ig-like domain-containing protein [Microbacterium sulfonylureivorans]|uniref:Ig-like domain-containing protein n=1 Tax=Microbacterium sulfonylureivorans TaxID=2486854 RepID=UPI000FD82DA4|nr:Ig-like domain-containing protein [Microbacterium sulfonylureivorans]